MSKKPAKKTSDSNKGKAALVGIGLDNTDGHKRITSGDQFAVVGGSEETHGRMTETLVKTFEELKARGKHLSEVEARELGDILHKSTPQ